MPLMPFDQNFAPNRNVGVGLSGVPMPSFSPVPAKPLPGQMAQMPMARGQVPPPQMGFMDKLKQRFTQPSFYQNLAQNLGQLGGGQQRPQPQGPRPTPMPQMGGMRDRMQMLRSQNNRAGQMGF